MNVSTFIFYMYAMNVPKETKCTWWDLEVFSSFFISEEQLWKENFSLSNDGNIQKNFSVFEFT